MKTRFRINVDDLGFFPAIENSVLLLSAAAGQPVYSSWVTNYDPPSATFLSSPARAFAGLHLNLLEGPSAGSHPRLCDRSGKFCRRWVDFLWPDRALRLAVEEELELQCLTILDWFGQIEHADSHLHLHAIPWIFRLLNQAQRKFSINHIRNPHEPLGDGPSLQPKLLILRVLSYLHQSHAMPCYGISKGFRNTRADCLRVLQKGSRELVLHTQSGPFQGNFSDYRFLSPQQLRWRQQEHEAMLELVREL